MRSPTIEIKRRDSDRTHSDRAHSDRAHSDSCSRRYSNGESDNEYLGGLFLITFRLISSLTTEGSVCFRMTIHVTAESAFWTHKVFIARECTLKIEAQPYRRADLISATIK